MYVCVYIYIESISICMYVCICVYRERNVRCRVGILCGDCDGDGNRSAVKPRNERERDSGGVCV